jgi:probable rRNA maturation factor
MGITITATVRSYPRLPYEKMKNAVLGKNYVLSLVFIGSDRARSLNARHRKKTYVPNVLSFPLTSRSGEIYITPEVAKRECKKFGMSFRGYVGLLFIHGLLHLKGHQHGATMEKAEKKYLATYALQ